MKVFISWSGPKSRAVAELLQAWIRKVIQSIDPFISTEIGKGARWGSIIAHELDSSRAGIVCITRENLQSRWLHFEVGALSKIVDSELTEVTETAIWTFLVDVTPTDVGFPLAQFQHTLATKDDILKLLLTINRRVKNLEGKALPESEVVEVFELWWPKLEARLLAINHEYAAVEEGGQARSQREILEEVLEHVRSLRKTNEQSGGEGAGQQLGHPQTLSFDITGSKEQVETFVELLRSVYPMTNVASFEAHFQDGYWVTLNGVQLPSESDIEERAHKAGLDVGGFLPF